MHFTGSVLTARVKCDIVELLTRVVIAESPLLYGENPGGLSGLEAICTLSVRKVANCQYLVFNNIST